VSCVELSQRLAIDVSALCWGVVGTRYRVYYDVKGTGIESKECISIYRVQ